MSSNIKAKNWLDLAIGIAAGVCAIMSIDVELSVAAMDLADPSTLPNMHPGIRYLFIPVIAFGVFAGAAVLELLSFRVLRPRTTTRVGWLLLGCSYSLILVDLLLRHFTYEMPSWLAFALFASCIGAVHYWLYEKSQT
ncbi:MAG: hypothetical protein ABL931_12020 [Usitatibacteraceae bacterium]